MLFYYNPNPCLGYYFVPPEYNTGMPHIICCFSHTAQAILGWIPSMQPQNFVVVFSAHSKQEACNPSFSFECSIKPSKSIEEQVQPWPSGFRPSSMFALTVLAMIWVILSFHCDGGKVIYCDPWLAGFSSRDPWLTNTFYPNAWLRAFHDQQYLFFILRD